MHVGDMYSIDYAEAAGAGDVCSAYRDSGLPLVESLKELSALLMA
jgi:hypothetical protein